MPRNGLSSLPQDSIQQFAQLVFRILHRPNSIHAEKLEAKSSLSSYYLAEREVRKKRRETDGAAYQVFWRVGARRQRSCRDEETEDFMLRSLVRRRVGWRK